MLLERYRYDLVQIEGIEMAPYSLWLVQHPLWRSAQQKENRPEIPIGRPRLVFDDHNAEYVLQQRAWETDSRNVKRLHAAAYSYIQYHKLQRYERQVCQRCDRVIAVSDADRQALLRLDPNLADHRGAQWGRSGLLRSLQPAARSTGPGLRSQCPDFYRQDGLPPQRRRRRLVRSGGVPADSAADARCSLRRSRQGAARASAGAGQPAWRHGDRLRARYPCPHCGGGCLRRAAAHGRRYPAQSA